MRRLRRRACACAVPAVVMRRAVTQRGYGEKLSRSAGHGHGHGVVGGGCGSDGRIDCGVWFQCGLYTLRATFGVTMRCGQSMSCRMVYTLGKDAQKSIRNPILHPTAQHFVTFWGTTATDNQSSNSYMGLVAQSIQPRS